MYRYVRYVSMFRRQTFSGRSPLKTSESRAPQRLKWRPDGNRNPVHLFFVQPVIGPCKTGLQRCSRTFKTKQQKKQRRIKFPLAAYLCQSHPDHPEMQHWNSYFFSLARQVKSAAPVLAWLKHSVVKSSDGFAALAETHVLVGLAKRSPRYPTSTNSWKHTTMQIRSAVILTHVSRVRKAVCAVCLAYPLLYHICGRKNDRLPNCTRARCEA